MEDSEIVQAIHLPAGIFLVLAVMSGIGNFLKVSEGQGVLELWLTDSDTKETFNSCNMFCLSSLLPDLFLYNRWDKADFTYPCKSFQGLLTTSKCKLLVLWQFATRTLGVFS